MKPGRRIAHVCFPSLGGSGVLAAELAMCQAERGHQVILVATAPPMRLAADPNHTRVKFAEVRVSSYALFEHAPYGLAVTTRLIELAEAEQVDIIHLHYAVPHATSGYMVQQILGDRCPRVVVTLHGTDVTGVGADPSYRSITAFAVARADAVTTPSAWLRARAEETLGLPPGGVSVIPNFVDLERFKPRVSAARQGPPTLVHVSNFRPLKRPADAVEVLARIAESTPARLLMIGDGPERPQAEERARSLGVAERVQFLGEQRDVADLMAASDLFLLPSESESFGIAALEAMACAVPVVAYRSGGLAEVVAEGAGRLTPPGDVAAMAAAARELLEREEDRRAAGRAAREQAARFAPGPVLDQYDDLYERMMERDR